MIEINHKIRFLYRLFSWEFELALQEGIDIKGKKYKETIRWHKDGSLKLHFYYNGKKFYNQFIQKYPSGMIFELATYNEKGELDGEYINMVDEVNISFKNGRMIVKQ